MFILANPCYHLDLIHDQVIEFIYYYHFFFSGKMDENKSHEINHHAKCCVVQVKNLIG